MDSETVPYIIIPEPANVGPEVPLIGGVGVQGGVCVSMMVPMV